MSRRREHRGQGTAQVRTVVAPADEDPIETLIRRSRRQRRRGDQRGAVVLLRQACSMDEWRARTFTLLGMLLSEMGLSDDAVRALLHARWLRHRAGETSRADVTMQLVERARGARSAQ